MWRNNLPRRPTLKPRPRNRQKRRPSLQEQISQEYDYRQKNLPRVVVHKRLLRLLNPLRAFMQLQTAFRTLGFHERASFQFPNQPATPNHHHHHRHRHHYDDKDNNSQSTPGCTPKSRRARMARKSRPRTRHSRSIPTSTHLRHPRRIDPIPGLPSRAHPTRSTLRIPHSLLARYTPLRRRIPPNAPYALDGTPWTFRAQKVAGEFRTARACASY